MNKQIVRWVSITLTTLSVAMGLGVSRALADGGPLSIGARAVEFVPTDGDGALKGGVDARLRLPLFFAVDGSVDYRRDTFGATTARDWPLQLSALLYGPKIVWFQPYLLAGGGWYDTTVNGPNGFSGTQNRFGPHVGAGMEFDVNAHWFLDASYRFVWLNQIHSENAQGAGESYRDRGHMITLGLNYRL